MTKIDKLLSEKLPSDFLIMNDGSEKNRLNLIPNVKYKEGEEWFELIHEFYN
jgi:hypothetical protein